MGPRKMLPKHPIMEDANTVSSAQPVPWELREQDGPDLVWSFSYLTIKVVSFARQDPQGLELSLKQSFPVNPNGWVMPEKYELFLYVAMERRGPYVWGVCTSSYHELRPVSQGAARRETGGRRNEGRNIIQNLHFGLLPNLYAVWTLVTFANLPGHCFPAPIDKTSIKFAILAKIKNGHCQRCHYDDSPLRNGILRRVGLTKTYAPIPSMPRWRLSFSGLDGSTPFWVRVVQTEFTPPYDHRAYTYGSRRPEACTIRLAALKHGASLHYHQW
ncbi:hypothetical protein F5J12DRAFT_927999 [Pisolithus orientalis]|uniref:uncharacterized protein n=1 Tax=Pisolithus orientalis TaxID=936130 RepID=UPI0022254D2D|nr:uncharacterized protein F5J12DRAFT_927999 [Pisolithus orientalis]KAI6003536.1 hypothetical protein F5J12DRAFT_927999 [Pisolithus orientalis]